MTSETCLLKGVHTLKHHDKWEKPDTRGHLLCEPLGVKYPELVNPWRQTVDWGLLAAGERGQWEAIRKGFSFRKRGMFGSYKEAMVAQRCECTELFT